MAAPPPWGFSDLDPTTRWILARNLPTSVQAPTRPLSDDAWENVLQEARTHGLQGLLVGAVTDGGLPATAAQLGTTAELELHLTRARLSWEARAAEPLALLDEAGIEHRVLKGPALGVLDYPDPQLRPTSDLDLLVHGDDLLAAVTVLEAASGRCQDPEPTPGWARHVGKGATVSMPGGLEVDLHRLLVWGPFGVRLPVDELFTIARPFTVGPLHLQTLGREETLLHACAHLLVLGAVRAREVRDVAQLCTSPLLDVDRVLSLARRWGQEALLATAVRMADRELALEPGAHPLQTWAEGYRPTSRDRLWLRVESPTGRVHALEQLAVWLELGPGPARRVLWRGNVHPATGTYPGVAHRIRQLAGRLSGRT